jgi:hypothetical protein
MDNDYNISISLTESGCSSCNNCNSIDDMFENIPSTSPQVEYKISIAVDELDKPDAQPNVSYTLNGEQVPFKAVDQAPEYFLDMIVNGEQYKAQIPYDLSNIFREIDYSGMGRVLEWVSKTDGKWTQHITSVIDVGGKTKVQKFNANRKFVRAHEGAHNNDRPHEMDDEARVRSIVGDGV